MFGPIFEKASDAHPDIRFAKVDTESEQQLGGSLGIQSIPTIMAFRDGVLLFSQPGALPAASLDKLIASVREVDMVEVHKQIAEQETTYAQKTCAVTAQSARVALTCSPHQTTPDRILHKTLQQGRNARDLGIRLERFC